MAGMATGVAACGGSDSSSGGSGGASKNEKVTLTWWDYFNYSPAADKATNQLISDYESSHPNVTIKRTAIGFDDFRTKAIQAIATGNFPDFLFLEGGDLPIFVDQGALADLTSHLKDWSERDKYIKNVFDGGAIEGKEYGVPFRTNTTVLFYNTDMFKKAGIKSAPATWDELRASAKKLTKSGQSGFCYSASNNEEGTHSFLPFLWQAGSDVTTIGDAGSIKALKFVNDLVNVDHSAPKSVLSFLQQDAADQFAAGHCAMMVNGPWALNTADAAKVKYSLAPWPKDVQAAAPLGGEFAVAGNGDHVDQVWDLISWLSDDANLTAEQIKGLDLVPNRSDTQTEEKWIYNPMLPIFAKQLEVARPKNVYGAKYAEISPQISGMEQKVLSGQATPEEAAKAAGTAIKPLLPKSGS
jgi:multiple sugar transport system substrate-binding protein